MPSSSTNEEYKDEPRLPPVILDPVVFDQEFANSRNSSLAGEEIAFFKRQGFIVKRGLISEASKFNEIVDYVWNTVPDGIIRRDVPATWMDNPNEKWTPEHNQIYGPFHGANWKFRSPHGYGTEPFILEVTAQHPKVNDVVRSMIGHPVRKPTRVRGVYVVVPKPMEREGRLGPHVDRAAAQLSAMVFVAPTPPRCGGFTIWPGSHVKVHPFFKTVYSAYVEEDRSNDFTEVQREILATTNPVEFVGEPGDVVFWHPRLMHSAGVNYSAETNEPRVRFVIPCDFQRDGFRYFDDDEAGPGEKAQWWVCTRHIEEDVRPTENNMWDDWVI